VSCVLLACSNTYPPPLSAFLIGHFPCNSPVCLFPNQPERSCFNPESGYSGFLRNLCQPRNLYNLTFASPCIIIRFKQINQQDATISQVYYLKFMCGSICFGRLSAHHQERTTALGASGSTVGAWWLERCWSWSHDQQRSNSRTSGS
jgi:hypothetical protein